MLHPLDKELKQIVENFQRKMSNVNNWHLQNARNIIETWRREYNTERPHSSLDGLTPQEFMDKERVKLQLNLVQSMG